LAIIIASIVGYPFPMADQTSIAQEEGSGIEEEQQREDNREKPEVDDNDLVDEQDTDDGIEPPEVEEEGEEIESEEEVNEENGEEQPETSDEEETDSKTEDEIDQRAEDSKQQAPISSEEEEEPANEEATASESTDQSRVNDVSAGSEYEPGYIGTEGQIGDFIDSVRSSPNDEQAIAEAEQELSDSLEVATSERIAQTEGTDFDELSELSSNLLLTIQETIDNLNAVGLDVNDRLLGIEDAVKRIDPTLLPVLERIRS
jgi:hypothetical protein